MSLVMASACLPDATGVITLALNPPFDDAQLEVSRTATPSVSVRSSDDFLGEDSGRTAG